MTAPRASARQSMIDAEVARHTARPNFDPSLITITHTPNGIVTHVIAADGAVAPVVHFDDASGRVITKTVTEDFGTVLTVLGGPAVVEVALHLNNAQRITYAGAIQAVDQEAMSHVMVASRTAVLTILQHLGMPADEAPADAPTADDMDGSALWAQLLGEHGPCTCAAADDDTACDRNCALCAALPADAWPCPAWSDGGYGPGAVVER